MHFLEYQIYNLFDQISKAMYWPLEHLWEPQVLRRYCPGIQDFLPVFKTYYPDKMTATTLSCQERSERLILDEEMYTYGESYWSTLVKVLKELKLSPQDSFVDLGCGTGMMCFIAAFSHNNPVIGVDLIQSFVQNGQALADRFGLEHLRFLAADFRDFDFSQGTAFYCTCTCFDDPMLDLISHKMSETAVGSQIVTITHPLPGAHLQLEKVVKYWFSWGLDEAYFQRRI